MSAHRFPVVVSPAVLAACLLVPGLHAQGTSQTSLPPLAPTGSVPAGMAAPLAAVATPGDRAGSLPHAAQVRCTGGELEIHAQNSSLNGILKAISRCTGMRITGGVAEQRVFGDYGPAAPATVLATLIDGTGTNMLLQETDTNQPAQLILTPRTGGVTPPAPTTYSEAESGEGTGNEPSAGQAQPQQFNGQFGPRLPRRPGQPMGMEGDGSNRAQPNASGYSPATVTNGSAVTGPQPIPQPYNNVNGSPDNRSPTASTLPTTNSVPLDSVRTPSTTPSTSGIVDAPNPPPAGSDTAAAGNGAPAATPSAPNTTGTTTAQPGTDLTPEQIFQQLLKRQQQQQQNQQQQPGDGPQTNPQ